MAGGFDLHRSPPSRGRRKLPKRRRNFENAWPGQDGQGTQGSGAKPVDLDRPKFFDHSCVCCCCGGGGVTNSFSPKSAPPCSRRVRRIECVLANIHWPLLPGTNGERWLADVWLAQGEGDPQFPRLWLKMDTPKSHVYQHVVQQFWVSFLDKTKSLGCWISALKYVECLKYPKMDP